MNENLDSTPRSALGVPVKATSSFFDAFTSLFNLFMVSAFVFFIGVNVMRFFTASIDILMLVVTIFALVLLVLYIWAILTRSLQISDKGIDYREAFRSVSLGWDEIEAVKVEKLLGQITFWVNNKKIRVHTFGLNRRAQKEVHKALESQVKARAISIR